MSPLPRGTLDTLPVAALTATKFVVWDHSGGAAYSWSSDAWTEIAPMGGPALQLGLDPIAVGAPSYAVYVAAPTVDNMQFNGSVYAVESDSWRPIPPPPAPLRARPVVVATDDGIVVWGGAKDGKPTNVGGRLELDRMVWRMMSSSGAPPPMVYPATAWTGDAVFVWGGSDHDHAYIAEGGMYDLRQDAWSPVSTVDAPRGDKKWPLAVWAGDRVVVFSGDDTALYDPSRDDWTRSAPPPSGRAWRVSGWDGCRVLAYGSGELWAYKPPN